MFQLINDTPFPAQLGLFVDPHGHQIATVVLKATLRIPGPQLVACEPALEQLPVLPEPTYEGQPGQSSIHHPADLVPSKQGTDVVFVGHAYTPGHRRMTELPVHLQVGSLRKSIDVVGDRQWVAGWIGATMSSPVPFVKMPLVYERAYGGRSRSSETEDVGALDERNPVGTGYCASRHDVNGQRLPNLEDPRHRIRSWRRRPPVAGFGAVDAHWSARRQWAGTYDDRWRVDRCPVLPMDFDPRFHQVAGDRLCSSRSLRGELSVTLVHLAVDPVLRFRIPDIRVRMGFALADVVEEREGQLWTVLLEPDEQRVVMVWGASCRIGKRPSALGLVELQAKRAA